MDKIVKHRFWILLALVPPLVVFGYYKANGAIKSAITTRTQALDTALSAVPDGKGPNPTWVKAADGGIEIYNEEIAKAVNIEKVRVWEDQLPRLTFPVEMQSFVPKTAQGHINYRGDLPREAGFTYKDKYQDQLEALYQSIEPLKQEKDGGVSGKVHLNRSAIPRHRFGQMLITSEAMWDAQEDLWLLQLLFDSIRNVNRPAENAAKSAVRRLSYIKLMGGDGQSTVRSVGGSAVAGGDARGFNGDEDDPATSPAMMGRGGPMGAMGAMGAAGQTAVNFDPSEEFGIGIEGVAGGGGVMGPGDEDAPALSGRMMDYATGSGPGGVGGGFGQKEIRYIKFDPAAAFRERGFYMSVLIDQKKIADFLVELSNADWPIRIVRFNVGPNTGATGVQQPQGRFMAGGRSEDSDDLSNMFLARGGARFESGGSFGNEPDITASGFGGDDLLTTPLFGGENGDERDARGMGVAGGMYGPTPMVRGDQLGSLFTHPDLVQLDLCGIITMYNPPAAEALAVVTGGPAPGDAATAAVPAEGADSAGAGDAATTTEPAAEGGAAEPSSLDAPALDATVPAGDAGTSPDAATSPDVAPAAEPAADAAIPAEPSVAPPDSPASDPPTDTTVPAPET